MSMSTPIHSGAGIGDGTALGIIPHGAGVTAITTLGIGDHPIAGVGVMIHGTGVATIPVTIPAITPVTTLLYVHPTGEDTHGVPRHLRGHHVPTPRLAALATIVVQALSPVAVRSPGQALQYHVPATWGVAVITTMARQLDPRPALIVVPESQASTLTAPVPG